MVSLDELIKHLTDINTLVTAEEKMSAFFKQISKTVSDFDTETDHLLKMLHTQRDQQVTGIYFVYQMITAELLNKRVFH